MRGVSALTIGLCASALASLSAALVVSARAAGPATSALRAEVAALLAAQAGLAEAVFSLNTGGPGALGSREEPVRLDGSRYWVEVEDLSGGMKGLVATGLDAGAGARLELTVQRERRCSWRWAAFGAEGIVLDGNVLVDSYDSGLGTYASQLVDDRGDREREAHALRHGHVGSNGPVDVLQNARVFGDAVPGPASTASVTGRALVSGSTEPSSAETPLPPAAVAPAATPERGPAPTVLAAGDHRRAELVVEAGTVLTLTGPARVAVDRLELRPSSQVVVDATAGPVELHVLAGLVLGDDTSIASTTRTPSDVSIHLASDGVVRAAGSTVYGTLLAPRAAIVLEDGFELFGAVAAREVHLGGWARVHFDEALLDTPDAESGASWRAVCLREQTFNP